MSFLRSLVTPKIDPAPILKFPNTLLVYKLSEILGFKVDSHIEELVETVELKIDEYNKNEKENELIRQGIYFTTTPIFNNKKAYNGEDRMLDMPSSTLYSKHEIQYYLIKFDLIKKKQKFKISDVDALQFITKFFNETKPIVFIDGLDEVKNVYKQNILEEIEFLGSKSRNFKIILTSRFGESISNLTGFNTCRILSLDNFQIDDIIKIFSDEPEKFKNHLANKPYNHILNRPLFLTYLIAFFNREGYLPSRHIDVYRNIIDLVTKAWDITRSEKIKRESKYNFWSIEKEEFLAELAFDLTYEGNHLNFSETFFKDKFYNLCNKYELPNNQIEEIFNEIQSHTGLIVKSFNYYSFCHPCLQEYLCALHMRHSPISEVWYSYFDEYPEILAVATSLSQASDAFIAEIFLSDIRGRVPKSYNPNMVNRFLERLFIENPKFKASIELGFTALHLSFHYLNLSETEKSINLFLNKNNVMNSIKLIRQYYTTKFDDNYAYLERTGLKGMADSQYRIIPPQNSILFKEYYNNCCA